MANAKSATQGEVPGDARPWWHLLVWGILAIVLGIFLLLQPAMTAVSLIWFVGLFWVVGGAVDVVEFFFGKSETSVWKLLISIAGFFVGLAIVLNPLVGSLIALTLQYFLLGIAAVGLGLFNMIFGGHMSTGHWSWGTFFLGLLQFLIGIFLIMEPLVGVMSLVWLLAMGGIAGGVVAIVLAFMKRKSPVTVSA
jgi:uncharacterized membrane protein HdeD (DUF308 family)